MNTPLNRTLVRAFLENIPDYIYFKDRRSRFLVVSASMARYYGVPEASAIIGRTDHELRPGAQAAAFAAEEERIIRTGHGFEGRVEQVEWSDGRITWCVTTKLPLRGRDGEIVGTFGISKDITAEKELEASLDRTTKELVDASRLAGMAEVATGVLHNVGNVLNSLNVSATVIAGTLRRSKAASLAKAAQLVRQNAGQLAAFLTRDPKGMLIPDYLASLARALAEDRANMLQEADSLRRNIDHIKEIVAMQQAYATTAGVLEPLAPASLMEDSLRMNGSALAQGNIQLVRDYADVQPVWAERGKVLQILINLIRNAKYAVEESSTAEKAITLRVSSSGCDRVCLVVEDNGIGIPAENLTRIFGHGFTTRAGGHGFGLHSSALAAKELGGSLTVCSDGPGRGARFTLELPAAAVQATAA